MPELSVIIPTYNRQATLMRVLDGLARQEGVDPQQVELVVADDGSQDGTAEAVARWAAAAPVRLRWSPSSENRGPAHSRNRALSLATGSVLLMTGDDILPSRGLLARHVEWHAAHPAEHDALLGRVVWPEDPPPTPFMRWWAQTWRAYFFDYPDKAGPVAGDRFYTCNVSVKRSLVARCGGFDESFPRASHEDLEFGLRLARQGGMNLYYDPEAVGIHHHQLTFVSSFRRVYYVGYTAPEYWRKVGEAGSMAVRLLRRAARSLAAPRLPRRMLGPFVRRGDALTWPLMWKTLLHAAFWCGVADAARGRPPDPPDGKNTGCKGMG